MGVDLTTYRANIGTFSHSVGIDVVSVVVFINMSGALKTIGSVLFISILLIVAGIEPNPGPQIEAKHNTVGLENAAMHTVLIADTSGSMTGEPLVQVKQFISQFIEGLEEIQVKYNLQENVALVTVGVDVRVVQHFTNDFSLIRRAVDEMTAAGPSPLHIALNIQNALLSHWSLDDKAGVFQIDKHIVSPRVIVLSDGYISLQKDEPGQIPQPHDTEFLYLQMMALHISWKTAECTLCKIYTVPIGNANQQFLGRLSSITGVKMMSPNDSRFMSRHFFHHFLVSKLLEQNQPADTRKQVRDIVSRISPEAEHDDMNGVLDILRQGVPRVANRDQQTYEKIFSGIIEKQPDYVHGQNVSSQGYAVVLHEKGFSISAKDDYNREQWVHETVRVDGILAPKANQAVHTLIIVDTCSSMEGGPIEDAKSFISQFISGLEVLQPNIGLPENVALASVGDEILVVQNFTNDYSLIRNAAYRLKANGASKLLMGMLIPVAMFADGNKCYQGGCVKVENHRVPPRVILISNGINRSSALEVGNTIVTATEEQFDPLQTASYIEFLQKSIRDTECKIFPVVCGEPNGVFIKMLLQILEGRAMTRLDATHMSRYTLQHFIARNINLQMLKKPEMIAKRAREINDIVDERDIDRIIEIIKQGEPDSRQQNTDIKVESDICNSLPILLVKS